VPADGVRPVTGLIVNFVSKVVRHRGLIRSMVQRDLKSRYVGSVMGIFWSVIHPLALLVCYTFVFSVIWKLQIQHPRFPETGTASFAIYLFCGILPWMMFQETLTRSSNVLVDNANLITKTLFPSEILPVAVLIANLVNHLIGLAIFLVIILFYLQDLSVFVLLIPLYLLPLMLFALGLSWVVSSLQVFLRDTAQVVTVVLTFWFFFTPIFYTEEHLDGFSDKLVLAMRFNPLAEVVIAYRKMLLFAEMPSWQGMIPLYGMALVTFVCGGLLFRYVKRSFADVL
jgi:ABC-type polysaccharide/polyol phosphate export permease